MTSGRNNRHQRGIALLIAIFTLLLLTAIGAGMVALTNMDVSISSNYRDEQIAFFSAKAGLEEVRDRFRSGASNTLSTNSYFSTSNLAGQTNGVLYITNPDTGNTVTPWVTNGAAGIYPDNEICSELSNMGTPCGSSGPTGSWYLTTSASTAYAPTAGSKLPWKWARITAKTNLTSSGTTATGSSLSSVDGNLAHTNYRVCWNGASEVAIPNATTCAAYPNIPQYLPVYVITVLAQTPSGSRRMVQAEAAMTTFPSIPGPLVFDGPNPQYSPPSSNSFQVNGTNYSSPANGNGPGTSCPSGQPSEYALGAFNGASATTLQGDDSKRQNSYTGLLNPNGTSNVLSAGDVSSQLGSLATVQGLNAVVSSVTLVAGNEGNVYGNNPSTIVNPGTIANPQVNVVQGNLTLSGNWTGSGILLVTGTLTLNGTPSYDGIILVIGTGTVTAAHGGGSATIDGSILVANLYDSSGKPLPTSGPPGSPTYNWNGGGGLNLNYDSCWSTAMSTSLAWRIVAMREIIR